LPPLLAIAFCLSLSIDAKPCLPAINPPYKIIQPTGMVPRQAEEGQQSARSVHRIPPLYSRWTRKRRAQDGYRRRCR
jgi:hypothetical protein